VGDGQRRVQVVRYEEHARARGRDLPDEREETVALVPRQVGSRLIEHEQAAAAVAGACRQTLHGPGDGELRALHGSQVGDSDRWINRDPKTVDDCLRPTPLGWPRDEPAPGCGQVCQPQVLGHAQRWDQTEVLVHEAHAELGRPRGLHRQRDRLPVDLERATGVRGVVAREHLHQCGFARSVGPEETVDLARQHGALVIFDEVISGFRVAMGGMAEVLGIRPDLVTYGKVIGGGFPVGAYGGRRDLMELVAPSGPVYQAGTLSANPVGMRAGLATLQKIERVGAFAELDRRTAAFCANLNEQFAGRDLPVQITQTASLFWLHAKTEKIIRRLEDIPPTHAEQFARIFHSALDRGVYFAPSGYEVSFLSLAHTDEVLERASTAILEAVAETVPSLPGKVSG